MSASTAGNEVPVGPTKCVVVHDASCTHGPPELHRFAWCLAGTSSSPTPLLHTAAGYMVVASAVLEPVCCMNLTYLCTRHSWMLTTHNFGMLVGQPAQSTSYVSRRRMDDATFDPNAVDSDGLPLVGQAVMHTCMHACIVTNSTGSRCAPVHTMRLHMTICCLCLHCLHAACQIRDWRVVRELAPSLYDLWPHASQVYNEARISEYWGNKPGELLGRWTRFTAISGAQMAELHTRVSCTARQSGAACV